MSGSKVSIWLCLVILGVLTLAPKAVALERPPLPEKVRALCQEHYPEHVITAADGFGDDEAGQWALVLTKGGQHLLAVIEKAKQEPAYRFTIQNPSAIMPGDSRPSVLIDSAGDALFLSFRKESALWTFHAVKRQGAWGPVDLIIHYDPAGASVHTEWGMFVKGGMLFSEQVITDGNDNILERYPYPPIPVPQLEGKTRLGAFDWALFPDRANRLLHLTETSHPESLAALTPRGWTLRQAEISPRGIFLLGQDDKGQTRLLLKRWLASEENITQGAYRDTLTLPLPESAWIDEQSLYLSPSGPGFTLCHTPSGGWRVCYIMGDDWFEIGPSHLYCDMSAQINPDPRNVYGDLPFGEVESLNFSALPLTYQEALKALDQSRWAMVNNPDPKDRLHLREAPDRGAPSLGKFYNGTPLKVLESGGGWTKVRIARLTGWMMTDYLAFGADINQVLPAFPTLTGVESLKNEALPLYAAPDEESPVLYRHPISASSWRSYHIVGVTENGWFYVYFPEEDTGGYMKQAWFWEGNG